MNQWTIGKKLIAFFLAVAAIISPLQIAAKKITRHDCAFSTLKEVLPVVWCGYLCKTLYNQHLPSMRPHSKLDLVLAFATGVGGQARSPATTTATAAASPVKTTGSADLANDWLRQPSGTCSAQLTPTC